MFYFAGKLTPIMTTSLKCNICKKDKLSPQAMIQHWKDEHAIVPDELCPICAQMSPYLVRGVDPAKAKG